ncbi:hypothetical protein pipiens_006201 [Culex pipiens pipiens]|uniref:Uncharacterized protein n=1 Tax=Culex pipiens pipiens TaxID=38569 RepID=A0ABD1DRS9_CULPP
MSVNITVHAAAPEAHPDPFASLESVRKADSDKRRRARLEQVRQQSKELAAKVRRNFKTAKQKELANVEKIKQEELKRWKQKNISQLQSEYQFCLEDVGEAHKAAEAAEQCEIWFQEKKAAQQAAALVRGKQAETKLAEQIQQRESQRPRKRKEYKPSKSVGIQVNSPPQKPLVDQPAAPIRRAQDDSSSSVNTPSAFEQFRKGPKTKSVPDLRSLSPGFVSSSDEELLLPSSGKNKENIPSHNSARTGPDTLYYNANSFTSPDTLHYNHSQPPQKITTRPAASIPPLKPFTQVSDFIKRRRDTHKPTPYQTTTYSSQKAVQFDADLSENTLSFPTSTALDQDHSMQESPRKPARKLLERPRAPPTTATVSSSKQSVGEGGSTKVQYYDHLTKFRKEYEQPLGMVHRNGKGANEGEMNAMQEAERHERLQEEMLKARRQPQNQEDRSKLALEKLQTRKDYENLKAELDKLVKAECVVKSQNPPSKPILPSEHRQRQRSATRQKRANDAVEDLIQQRVLITCPRVREAPPEDDPRQRPSQINVAAATASRGKMPLGDAGQFTMDSSDSCSTILLGLDPSGGRAGIPLPREGDKIVKLKELLEQINEQRKLLTEELEKEEDVEEPKVPVKMKSTKVQTENGVQKLERRQEELEEQQRKLHEKEREVHELEKQLKEKMNRFEREKVRPVAPKVPITIEAPGNARVEQETSSNDSVKSGSDIPVKIVITLNDKSQKKIKKTPKKVAPEVRKRKKATEQVDAVVQPETPKPKPAKEVAPEPPIIEHEQSPISSTTSTIYRQLPAKIDNRVGQLVKQLVQNPTTEPIQPQPQKSKKPPAPKHQLQKAPPAPIPNPPAAINGPNQLNPNLMQYIVRLLGMSRQSIEQLGVSSSTSVSTPHESVVNVSGNQSVVLEEDPSRMNRLRHFIDDNYNFLSEIDETLKEQDLTGSANENISRVEDIWMRTLNRKEREIRREKPKTQEAPKQVAPPIGQSPPVKESPLKSILKSPKKLPSKVAKIITPQGHVEVINLSDRDEQEVLQKYSQLTESCSKRISELSEMIQKVREEKKKLIENSLSSTEHQESSTKYMDLPPLPPKPPSKSSVETSPRSTRSKDDPVSEEINRILSATAATRHIGLSKDSGIAMSRPVTSSDYRDSPEVVRPPNAGAPQFESSEDLSSREAAVPVQQQQQFEPLLKDIPKVAARVLSETNEPQPTTSESTQRAKPPVAIRRFSPQLEEANAAHELSTILEVETPLASKTNISIPASEPRLDPAEQLLVEARDKLLEHARALGYEGFPNYEEYLRRENLDGTRFDPEKTSLSRLNELLEVTGKSDQLRYQKYPLPAPEINVTEDTLKIGEKQSGTDPGESNSSSSASLPDVVAELKLRNIIDKSFNNSLDDSNRSTSDDSEVVKIVQPVPQVEKSPSKRKLSKKQDEATESLGRDLNQLGMKWASSMLRKNQEVLNDHSSSSSLSLAEDLLRKKPSSNEAASGKPLNLKEFIARELMIRTHSDLNSLSDSSSPCSLLLKSLLDISHINTSTPELLTQTTTDKNVQRTSTPVAASKSSSGTPREINNGTAEGSLANLTAGLFSGESRISSVHQSSSSGGENRLSVPTLRLNVEKYRKE